MQLLLLVIFSTIFIRTLATDCETLDPDKDFPFETEVCSDQIVVTSNPENEWVVSEYSCTLQEVVQNVLTYKLSINSCDKIKACAEYNVTVQAFNQTLPEDKRFFSKNIKALYADPVTKLKPFEVSSTSIKAIWTVKNPYCVKKFIFTINSTNFQRQEVIDDITTEEHEQEVTALVPCKQFNVTLTTEPNSRPQFDIVKQVETKYADPGPVVSPKVNVTDPHTLILSWSKPQSTECVRFYIIKLRASVCGNDDCAQNRNISATDSSTTHFEDLEACEVYKIDIRVNGDKINNNWCTKTRMTKEALNKVEEFNVSTSEDKPTVMNAVWNPPKLQRYCIDKYEIKVVGPEKNHKIITTKTTYDIMDLKPCAKYNITITAIDLDGIAGESLTVNQEAAYEQPDKIENVLVAVGTHNIHIFWEPPNVQQFCVKTYRTIAWEKDVGSPWNNTFENENEEPSVNVKNLTSCVSYDIQVIPVTSLGEGQNYITSETTQAAPYPAPVLALVDASHDSLKINATIESNDNRCDIYSVRFSCVTAVDARIQSGVKQLGIDKYQKTFEAKVEPLSPNTPYVCNVSIYNDKLWSENGTSTMTTSLYYPEKPTNVSAISKSSKTIKVKWSPPRYPNGDIRTYEVHIQTIEPKYKVPSVCPPFNSQKFDPRSIKKEELEISDLLPYVEYSVQVAAANDFGTGEFTSSVSVVTKPDVPTPPEQFYDPIICGPEAGKPYSANATISWTLPCASNGEIIKFEGMFKAYRNGYEHEIFSWSQLVTEAQQEIFYYPETRLKPEHDYTVTVAAIAKDVTNKSVERQQYFISPAGIPTDIPPAYADVDTVAASNPTTSAVVRFSKSLLHSEAGSIKYVALMLSQKDCQQDPQLKSDVIRSDRDWPKVLSWTEAHEDGCIKQYQTTPVRWYPKNVRVARDENDLIYYYIGDEDCSYSSPGNMTEPVYCNGPLRADTSYHLVIRLFTTSGYSDLVLTTFHTDSIVKWYLVVLLVLSCLTIAFFSGFIYMWVNKKILGQKETTDGVAEQTGDVAANSFYQYYQELSKSDKIQREYRELTSLTNDLSLDNSASKLNPTKNRYTNIFPYDKNRVILDVDEEGSDYINASFINGYKHRKEFIATQGPKPETFVDFWRMILQHNVYIIVMVTKIKEGDIIKCHQYFPHLHQEMQFGNDISVSCIRETSFDTYVKREFKVEHTGEAMRKPVLHFQFKKWPDHECPSDTTDLINFVRVIRAEKNPSHSPITIHCSAGVGRTGSLIALDIIMRRLKVESKINIFETVKKLRFQRMLMVQTVQQYSFLYACAYELVKNKRPTKPLKRKSKFFNVTIPEPRQSFSPSDIESVM